jgi:hypothetical protein
MLDAAIILLFAAFTIVAGTTIHQFVATAAPWLMVLVLAMLLLAVGLMFLGWLGVWLGDNAYWIRRR